MLAITIGQRDEVVRQPRVRLWGDVVEPGELPTAAVRQSRIRRDVECEGRVVDCAALRLSVAEKLISQRR